MKAIHKKVVKGVGLVVVCTLVGMVLTSAGLWIFNGSISWTKPWERGSLSLLFFVVGAIESAIVGIAAVIDEKGKTTEE